MTNKEIDTHVRKLTRALLTTRTSKKAMTELELGALEALVELSSNLLQNINTIALTARGERP